MDTLSPDTSYALMQAGQSETARASNKLEQVVKTKNMERINEAAQEFEAIFIAEMMKPMFQGISTEAPFGGGRGEEIFRGQMLQEYGKIVAKTGGIGVAEQVRAEMIRLQEAQQAKTKLAASGETETTTETSNINTEEQN